MRFTLVFLIAFGLISCSEDRYFKQKFDETVVLTNKSSGTLKSVKMWGGNGINPVDSKVWSWENIPPDSTLTVRFNIKRDIKVPEGSIFYEVVFLENDTLKTGTYFTNWQLLSVEKVDIYENRIVIVNKTP